MVFVSSQKCNTGEIDYDPVSPNHQGPNTMRMIKNHILELVLAHRHQRVLDLPCGKGGFSQMLLDRGVEVVSADLHPEVFIVPGRSGIHADLNAALPFSDGEFDAMVCIEGIEHIENPHLLAREANRILRGTQDIATMDRSEIVSSIRTIERRISILIVIRAMEFRLVMDAASGKSGETRL